MKNREWIYVQKPHEYEMACDLCGGDNIEWSEFEGMIWCYDCEKDTPGTGGIFDGIIPVHGLEILGVSLKRYYFQDKEIRVPKIINGKIEYVPVTGKEVGDENINRGSD